MGGNPFYSNAEAYAYEILQQKLIKKAQQTAQQTVMELSALKTLFNQGQFIYCIPFGGTGLLGQNIPYPMCSPFNYGPVDPNPNFMPVEPYCLPYAQPPIPPVSSVPSQPPIPPIAPIPPVPPPTQNATSCAPINALPNAQAQSQLFVLNNKQSTIHLNLKNQPKTAKFGPDDCCLGEEGIDVSIDLRDYIPAEIYINVEEKSVEIRANHVSDMGTKTFARRYDLPACIILDSVKCVLSPEGCLLFSAAWLKID